MSEQSLLELEDYDLSHQQRASSQQKDERRPQPKPRQRTKIPKAERDYNVEDEVLAFSSGGSQNEEKGDHAFPRKKHHEPHSSAAFDNPTFVTDEQIDSDGSAHNRDKTVSDRGNSSRNRPAPNSRQASWTSTNALKSKESSPYGSNEDVENLVPEVPSSKFTVEREKYRDVIQLQKKPPKPTRAKGTTAFASPAASAGDDRNRRDSTATEAELENDSEGVESVNQRKKPKSRQDHLVVQMEPSGDANTTDDGKAGADESAPDNASVSSVATIPPKNTQGSKSRFSKLFSSDKKKQAPPQQQVEGKEKSGFVNRWKQTAHSFLKSSSKSIEETEEVTDDVERMDAGQGDKGKSAETRIAIPEDESESEEELEERSNKKDNEVARVRKSKSSNLIDKMESESDQEVPESVEDRQEKPSQFMSKLLGRSKKSEKQKESSKEPEDEDDEPPSQPPEKETKTMWKRIVEKQQARKGRSKEREPVKEPEGSGSSDEENIDNLSSDSDDNDKSREPSAVPKSPVPQRRPVKKEVIQVTDSAGKDLLLGISLHSCDTLPLDPNVIHPLIKVTVMFQNGEYIKRSELSDASKGSTEGKKRKLGKHTTASLSTSNVKSSVLPIMSQPCQGRHSIPTFAPTWNELIVFEEPFRLFALFSHEAHRDPELDPIIFFEIMDFLPMSSGVNGQGPISGFHGSDKGWYKVAWAFLKPLGANSVTNLNRKLRLQLFKPVKLRAKLKHPGPEVFSWWKSGKREKINCTLYVTPKGISPPTTEAASLRQLLSMRKEHLTQAILDSQLVAKKKKSKRQVSLYELREQASWTRMEGQSCKPPNKLVVSLPSSQIESLNIVVSGNVHCVKFSPCGTKLAASLNTDELHVVLLFAVQSWTLQKSLKGHHGLIYDLAWKVFELDDHTSYHYLATASADSSVRIWKMENNDAKTTILIKELYHPSFVYCVQFHPTLPGVVVTGCFDCVIRVWDLKLNHYQGGDLPNKKHGKKKAHRENSNLSPIILLDEHRSFVNCLLFDQNGHKLYSGDGSACLIKWSTKSSIQKKSWKLDKDAKLLPGDVAVNSIDLHPTGSRILVHLRDNFIKILDATTFIPLISFSGLKNERFQIRSCFSPCGNLVLSGSEDTSLCIWDADTGKILQFTSPRNSAHSCIVSCVDYHPFDYYVAVGLASLISEPSPILVYFHETTTRLNYPLLKKTASKFRASLDKSRSQSTDTVDGHESRRSQKPLEFARREDSSEKFRSIIQKLDTALYLAQQRNKQRQHSEAQSSTNLRPNQESQKLPQDDSDINRDMRDTSQVIDDTPPDAGEVSEVKSRMYIRRSRPRSASFSTKDKRARFRQAHSRGIQSDSEQIYELKKEGKAVEGILKKVRHSSAQEDYEAERDQYYYKNNRMRKQDEVLEVRPKPLKRRSIARSTDSNGNVF